MRVTLAVATDGWAEVLFDIVLAPLGSVEKWPPRLASLEVLAIVRDKDPFTEPVRAVLVATATERLILDVVPLTNILSEVANN